MNPKLSWTQPLCDECWAERQPGRVAHRLVEPENEVCCWCGLATASGIYFRVDPATVYFPRVEVE